LEKHKNEWIIWATSILVALQCCSYIIAITRRIPASWILINKCSYFFLYLCFFTQMLMMNGLKTLAELFKNNNFFLQFQMRNMFSINLICPYLCFYRKTLAVLLKTTKKIFLQLFCNNNALKMIYSEKIYLVLKKIQQ